MKNISKLEKSIISGGGICYCLTMTEVYHEACEGWVVCGINMEANYEGVRSGEQPAYTESVISIEEGAIKEGRTECKVSCCSIAKKYWGYKWKGRFMSWSGHC